MRGSSSATAARSVSTPRERSVARQSSTTVSARLPSRSIFTSPSASTPSLSCWAMTQPLVARWHETKSVIGPGATTTPPGCRPRWRGVSSSPAASPSTRRMRGSSKGKSRHSGVEANESASGFSPGPLAFASSACGSRRDQRFTSTGGTPSASADSRKAERIPNRLTVAIIAVRSGPKASKTCSSTSSRRRQQKSRSMSGRSLRAGLRKRSKGSR